MDLVVCVVGNQKGNMPAGHAEASVRGEGRRGCDRGSAAENDACCLLLGLGMWAVSGVQREKPSASWLSWMSQNTCTASVYGVLGCLVDGYRMYGMYCMLREARVLVGCSL